MNFKFLKAWVKVSRLTKVIVTSLVFFNIECSHASSTQRKHVSDTKIQPEKNPLVDVGKTKMLVSKDNNQKIELTVINEGLASELFSELATREDIPYEYQIDGCYARAHKMIQILEEKKIIAGKAFIEGKIYLKTKEYGEVGWKYQVAPVVMVKKGSLVAPYIMDPSLFSKIVPYKEWEAMVTSNPKTKIDRKYFTNRFSYDFNDRNASYTEYQEESLDDMSSTNRDNVRQLYLDKKTKQRKEINSNP